MSGAREQLSALRASFARAGTPRRDTFSIAGAPLGVSFLDPAMRDLLLPALAHRLRPAADTALELAVWNGALGEEPLPRLPWLPTRPDERRYVEEGSVRMLGFARRLLALDAEAGFGLVWYADRSALAGWEAGAPLRTLFDWWFTSRGLALVHAAAVGRPGGGALLVGPGGSGKSTSALACLGALGYIADDYCLLEVEPEPRAHSLYSSAKRARDAFPPLPTLAALPDEAPPGLPKALYFLHRHRPDFLLPEVPLRALLVPRVTGAPRTTARRIPGAVALRALAPSTMVQAVRPRPELFARMAACARALPAWELALGRDPAEIPSVIDSLLSV